MYPMYPQILPHMRASAPPTFAAQDYVPMRVYAAISPPRTAKLGYMEYMGYKVA